MEIYERLSRVYDLGWSDFALKYLDFVENIIDERFLHKAKILDLACGTGNLALALGKRGHTVHGVDICPQMINKARLKTTGLPGITFDVCDMVQFTSFEKYDIVLCTFDSINYLCELNDVNTLFLRVATVLNKSGIFVFDSNTTRHYINRHHGTHQREFNGESFIHKCRYDPDKKEAVTEFIFPDGARETHRQRPYDLAELEPMLNELNLFVVKTFSRLDQSPYDKDSERIFCVAERRD